MFDGITRRVVSMWFPRLASDRALRLRPVEGPFALTLKERSANRLYCLNATAERHGLTHGMPYSDARAFCPDLISRPADPLGDRYFLHALRRWSTRYCPWVGIEGRDGLTLDVTGSAHLFDNSEAGMLADMRQRFARAGIALRLGLGDSRGGSWALSHYGEGVAQPGAALEALAALPVAALRLDPLTITQLQRLGLRCIGDLEAAVRAPLARRFGPELLTRLDQALGQQPEEITPLRDPPHYAVRMTLPEPIGLESDVMAGAERLLHPLTEKLEARGVGARVLVLSLRRVDQDAQEVELRLAAPLRDPYRILPLFRRGVEGVDAGYGIDQIRLEATQVEPLVPRQASQTGQRSGDRRRLDDLLTRIGTRIGLENIQRVLPADSHIPERSFIVAPAAYSEPEANWVAMRPRPLRLFAPEPIAGLGPRPPAQFRWRRMALTTARATGPERLQPEWWLEDEAWRSGLRDYWRVETHEGRRLWMFYTPQSPGWSVHGEFA
ncbi:MAG: DNA polymerase Y family protein [Pseudomonadota bacterium]